MKLLRAILAPARFVRDVVIAFYEMGNDGTFGTGHTRGDMPPTRSNGRQ